MTSWQVFCTAPRTTACTRFGGRNTSFCRARLTPGRAHRRVRGRLDRFTLGRGRLIGPGERAGRGVVGMRVDTARRRALHYEALDPHRRHARPARSATAGRSPRRVQIADRAAVQMACRSTVTTHSPRRRSVVPRKSRVDHPRTSCEPSWAGRARACFGANGRLAAGRAGRLPTRRPVRSTREGSRAPTPAERTVDRPQTCNSRARGRVAVPP